MRLLLINPRFPECYLSHKWIFDKILPAKRYYQPPLGLATLAALCPAHWQVEIVDENIEPVPTRSDADVIGVCGMGVQRGRQRELLEQFRRRGHFVVAGGSYASLCPEDYEGLADAVVAGESERIWPEFCRDLEHGRPRPLYRETGSVDLAISPLPRYELLKLNQYHVVGMQFARGCPFMCEFCDIIVMFGRKPRVKSPQQIGRELDLLRRLGVRNINFVDDNFIGDKRAAKELLRFLIDYQRRHNYNFYFSTDVTLNVSQDDELLRLLRQANFYSLFIGIESANENSLKETRKFQNLRQDMLTSVREIHSHGMSIYAGMIIGFDNDGPEIFDQQLDFIMRSGLIMTAISLLNAVPKTPLYQRLEREGRLLPEYDGYINTRPGTNLVPKQMSYGQLVDGYIRLYRRLLDDRSIAARIREKTRHFGVPIVGRERLGAVAAVRALVNFVRHALLPGGLTRVYQVLRTIPFRSPRLLPQVLMDWCWSLMMRDYVERHFLEEAAERRQPAVLPGQPLLGLDPEGG